MKKGYGDLIKIYEKAKEINLVDEENINDRTLEILYKRIFEKKSYFSIGKDYGLTSSRISHIYNTKIKYIESTFEEVEDGIDVLKLSNRSRNALMKNGIFTVEKLKRIVLNDRLRIMRGIGNEAYTEITNKISQFI